MLKDCGAIRHGIGDHFLNYPSHGGFPFVFGRWQLAVLPMKVPAAPGRNKAVLGAKSNSTSLVSPNRQPVHNREAPAAHCDPAETHSRDASATELDGFVDAR